MSSVIIVNYKVEVLNRFKGNKHKALVAIGEAAVEKTVDYMENKYGRPIRITGDLMRSITSAPEYPIENYVAIGTNMEYGPWVHDGTSRMKERPFLRDAIVDGAKIWQELTEIYLSDGFS